MIFFACVRFNIDICEKVLERRSINTYTVKKQNKKRQHSATDIRCRMFTEIHTRCLNR